MAEEKLPSVTEDVKIENMIYTIRGKQVMLDSDLAELYRVTTGNLNKAVKRNVNRFPEKFCFQITKEEFDNLRFHFGISSSNSSYGGRRYMPYAFTEQGIAMLSAVLKSDIAVEVSIKIMDSFVETRRFLLSNQELFMRIDRIELKQLEADRRFEKVFNYIAGNVETKQHIFFAGQIYDAFSLIVDLIKKAQKEIVLIDNYVDTGTLNLLRKKNKGVAVVIKGSGKGSLTNQDVNKFNIQYPSLTVKITTDFHDRFLILDDIEVYHIGASLKDAGKKSFGITKIEDETLVKGLIKRLKTPV